ncbi:Gibberellin 2-beta-dioxygenase 2 [Heracleum sosnowskyi]|uniref:gibberellin 2beta-dioxygenase n=1 Tax=Heracleum sosnowskyi TaxID=360622 RepID=A0AAD8GU58_9APIA|nr:Gibberellin 2-beta-dioxygenase 2 [Heracleum sosnowskyi]
MGVQPPNLVCKKETCRASKVPTINLSMDRSVVSQQILRACEEYGFFKLINHGVSNAIVSMIEEESFDFFAKPASEKQQAGPPNPFGYGCKTIGLQGDTGDLEYLLLEGNPSSVSQKSKPISNDLQIISGVVSEYVQALRGLTCDILDLVAEGLCLGDKSVLSRLIKDVESDAVFRVNHYPPFDQTPKVLNPAHKFQTEDADTSANNDESSRVGFGEHSDPQILTILRSNDVGGFQFFSQEGFWIPIPPNPAELCVIVGDTFQALTNDRFKSARHRVLANSSNKPRLSMMYFGAPSLNARICPLPEMVSSHNPTLYKPFTWCELKKAAYSLRLAGQRLDLFNSKPKLWAPTPNEGMIDPIFEAWNLRLQKE